MRVVVGMETSGRVRDAFRARGHDAVSVDLLPDQTDGPHHMGDLFQFMEAQRLAGVRYDLGIFHPECTYHTVSAAWAFEDPDFARYPGVGYHQKVKPDTKTGQDRREARLKAEADVLRIQMLPGVARKVIENPRGTIPTRLKLPVGQVIQPQWFGDDASKGTCFWFFAEDGSPLHDMALSRHPAAAAAPRMVCGRCGATATGTTAGCACVGRLKARWANQTDAGQNNLSPGAKRWQVRSDTYPGVAEAMADQWGSLPPPIPTTLF